MGTSSIIWLIGVICAIWCVLDIFKKNISFFWKLVLSIVVLVTSWVGILVYMLWAKNHVTKWFK